MTPRSDLSTIDLSTEQLKSYDVRPFADAGGYSQVALVCRACGGTVLVDDALRIDVVLGAIASGGSLSGHSETCTRRAD